MASFKWQRHRVTKNYAIVPTEKRKIYSNPIPSKLLSATMIG